MGGRPSGQGGGRGRAAVVGAGRWSRQGGGRGRAVVDGGRALVDSAMRARPAATCVMKRRVVRGVREGCARGATVPQSLPPTGCGMRARPRPLTQRAVGVPKPGAPNWYLPPCRPPTTSPMERSLARPRSPPADASPSPLPDVLPGALPGALPEARTTPPRTTLPLARPAARALPFSPAAPPGGCVLPPVLVCRAAAAASPSSSVACRARRAELSATLRARTVGSSISEIVLSSGRSSRVSSVSYSPPPPASSST